jgi:hypothetical protein
MKRSSKIAIVLAALCGSILMAPVHAAPPTVTPSPGYDARLQEQHAAASAHQPAVPVYRHPVRRHRHETH